MNILKGTCVKVTQDVIDKIGIKTVFVLENIGIPNKIVPIGGCDFKILSSPYIKNGYLILGKITNSESTHYLIMDISNENIYVEWNYNLHPERVFINSNIENLLLCNYIYNFFIHRLIISEALGAYYDNNEGGNYYKYADLLQAMISDTDKTAIKRGVWYSLIQEMRLGVI